MSRATQVLADLDDTQDWQEQLYVYLHAHPELSMVEVETTGEIARRLRSLGYVVHRLGGGVVGLLANGPGPTVLFRADIDALPIVETTGLSYASQRTATDRTGVTVGVMHACGHDVNVTCALGAAQLLADTQSEWQGTVVALFQPGQETAEGARAMVADGLVSRIPRPDVAFAQHIFDTPAAGQVAVGSGPVLSEGDSIRITLYGRGSHGAMPHLGVDAVVLAAAVVMHLQAIVARELAPGEFGVVTVGSVQAGQKSNVLPSRATLLINVRAYRSEVRAALVAAVERIVRGECAAAGSPVPPQFDYYERYPLTFNDPHVTARVRTAFEEHFGADRVLELDPVPTSEDFSVIPDAFGTPYTYWGLGGFAADSTVVPNHSPDFAPDMQPTLRTGTEAIVVAALAFLDGPAPVTEPPPRAAWDMRSWAGLRPVTQ